ncbi:hypothetical protein OPU71_04710 [Niveibacterium sp. 24ML]|uniref:hypothetical protein n=1 Tax=Niveibacterium sp. 24ML TaxID=2985512 RepID=UPI002270DE2D|nr:hypothetical protein [Niveibacterium sp. 24ML]MCX9155420.1 hypothetical protein [Niveibacterium sp. 24ML]
MPHALRTALPLVAMMLGLAACSPTPDADLWDCQLSVQKDNAGRSEADVAERGHSITACMSARGYHLKSGDPKCLPGAVTPHCYVK